MLENEEIIHEFLVESGENLDQLDQDLVSLEQDPLNTEILSRVFRAIHTIKGTCGFFGFHKLESLTHVGENLLSKMRDGVLTLSPDIAGALLRMVDAVREILGNIESQHSEGDADYSTIIDTLRRLDCADCPTPVAVEDVAADMETDVPSAAGMAAPVKQEAPAGDPPAAVVAPALAPPPVAERAADGGAAAGSAADSSIRVDVMLLDRLMNMVGELVLARNQTLQCTGGIEDSNLSAATQRLNLITTELQDAVMKTRMQPIGSAWNKLPRVVRDLSTTLGKKIRLDMEGQDTELDRTILEAIKDPLTHIVRNSIDHGIESPAARVAAGKPGEGFLALKSYHEGGQVIIDIIDDGGGINTERVSQKALERNLISRDQLAKMSERELTNLVFLPGFSTAEQVTNISGRGVGMDVVKTNIEKIGGTIDLQSQRGRGTTLKIRIPLTLAIVPALMVKCREECFAIPQVNLLELIRIDAEQRKTSIEAIQGSSVFRLRGNLLPLVYLDQLLQLEGAGCSGRGDEESLSIVVLQTENRPFGLVVDAIQDTEEIVVKPLGKQLQHLGVFAGAAVRGDGRVALVLDVAGTARMADIAAMDRRRMAAEGADAATAKASTRSVLVFRAGENGRYAVPLSQVARLEEFDEASVEHAGKRHVIQYRGEILPLVNVAGDRRAMGPDETAKLQVVVCANGARSLGLVVDQILDIADAPVRAEGANAPGQGPPMDVIQGRVTEFFDVDALLRASADAQIGALV